MYQSAMHLALFVGEASSSLPPWRDWLSSREESSGDALPLSQTDKCSIFVPFRPSRHTSYEPGKYPGKHNDFD